MYIYRKQNQVPKYDVTSETAATIPETTLEGIGMVIIYWKYQNWTLLYEESMRAMPLEDATNTYVHLS